MAPTTRAQGKTTGNAELVKDDEGQIKVAKKEQGAKSNKRAKTDDGQTKGKRIRSTSLANTAKEERDHDEANGGKESVSQSAGKADPGKAALKEQTLQPGKQEPDQDKQGHFRTLEQGTIYFFYRPKVQSAESVESSGQAASSLDDVHSAHLLLIPSASTSATAPPKQENKAKGQSDADKLSATTGERARKAGIGFRLLRLGKKRLPAPERAIEQGLEPGGIGGDASEAIWSVIADVGPDLESVKTAMAEKRYQTKTRGERFVAGSRPAGRGRYALMLHDVEPASRRSVRLAYVISHPTEMGDVQRQLGIQLSSSIRLSMRNPTLPQTGPDAPPAGLPPAERVEMDQKQLQEAFGGSVDQGGTRYTNPDHIEWLDRAGVELLMTRERAQSADKGAHTGAGDQQADALEQAAHQEGEEMSLQTVLDQIRLTAEQNPPNAMEGEWI